MALEYALGEELFRAFADEYLHRYPSESYNLANLGDRFATYLAETRPDRDEEVKEEWPDFMIELATFENAINKIFEEKVDQDDEVATRETEEENLSLTWSPLV